MCLMSLERGFLGLGEWKTTPRAYYNDITLSIDTYLSKTFHINTYENNIKFVQN